MGMVLYQKVLKQLSALSKSIGLKVTSPWSHGRWKSTQQNRQVFLEYKLGANRHMIQKLQRRFIMGKDDINIHQFVEKVFTDDECELLVDIFNKSFQSPVNIGLLPFVNHAAMVA